MIRTDKISTAGRSGVRKGLLALLLFALPLGLWGQDVGFDANSTSPAENVGSFTVAVSSTGAMSVDVAVGGSATNGTDYSLSTTSLTFPGGSTTQNITVTITDDALFEATETITLLLFNNSVGNIVAFTSHAIDISDNDAAPSIKFTTSTSSGSEGVTAATVAVSITAVSGLATSVDYVDAGTGSASSGGTDYSFSSGTATIPAGQTSVNVPITVVNDVIYETNQTVILTISNPTNAQVAIPISSHTYTITDNDSPPDIDFTLASNQGSEGVSPISIQLRLDAVSEINAGITYTVSGTATGGGTDHNLATGTATITASSLTTDLSVTISNDILDEADETILLTLSSPVNSDLVGNTTHTFTIQDDDATPTIAFSSTTSNGAENATPATLQIALSAAAGRDVTVDYAVTGGTATGSGTDYTLSSGTAAISAGATTVDVSLTVNDDALREANETVIVGILNPTNSTLGTNTSHTYTINDNEIDPTIQFSVATGSGSEGTTMPAITVSLSPVSGVDASINYSVTSGTANEGVGLDLVLGAGTATVTAGATSTTIVPVVNDDAIYEANETFVITLAGPANASLGATSTHTYTILENDSPPTIAFTSSSSSGVESFDPSFGITLSAAAELDVTVDYSSADATAVGGGTDYTLASGTATVSAGATTTNITATTINDDALDEDSETFSISLSNPSNATVGATSTHTYTITDNDVTPTIEFSTGSASGVESTTPVNPNIVLSAVAGRAISVDYAVTGTATSGTDFTTLADGTANIAAGESDSTLTIVIVDDVTYENSQTIIITLSNPVNATLGATNPTYTYTITNNDAAPSITFDAATSSGAESATPALLGLTASAVSEVDATVDYLVSSGTATGSGTDFTLATGTATITAGATTQSISIPIVNDIFDEPDETIVVTILNPGDASLGATTTHTYTITDDDVPPTVAFTALGSTGGEGTTPAQIEVGLSAISAQTITVDYAVTGGTATSGGTDYVLVSGTLNFAAGTTLDTISATIQDDQLDEADETIEVTLSNPNANATLGTITSHTFTITDDDDPPIAFTVGTVITTGGTVAATYWNGTNSDVDITVPVDVAASLNGGTIQLLAAVGSGSDQILGAVVGIGEGDLGTNVTISVTAVTLEAITSFGNDSTITFNAIITDANTNSTTGTESATTLLVDQADPAAFSVGAIVTTGGTVVATYWNETNTGIDIIVPLDASDLSLIGGILQLQAELDGTFEDLELPYTVSSADVTAGTVTLAVGDSVTGGAGVEELAGYSEGDILTVRTLLSDLPGNQITATVSASSFTVDTTPPTATLTYSDTLGTAGDVITITGTFDEPATSTPQLAIAYRDNNVAATAMDSVSTTVWSYDATLPTGNDSIATVTLTATDLAGNALTTANTTGRGSLVVDNTPPGYVISYTDSLVRVADVSDITVVFGEPVQATPTISVDYAGTGSDITTQDLSLGVSDSVWTYQITAPTGNDGFATLTVVALDNAGNAVVHTSGGTNTLKVDNMAPTISATSPVDSAFINSTDVSYALGETLDTGRVVWTWLGNAGVTDGASPHIQALTASEISAGSHSGELTDPPLLVHGGQYSIAVIVGDAAGNADTATVLIITYDTLAPLITGVTIIDGAGAADLDSTNVRLQYSLSFSGYVEDYTGIPLYEYSLGSTAGDSDVVAWTAIGTDTTATATGLLLGYKSWYYPTVRATDGAGNRTAHTTGDGVRIIDLPRVTLSVVQNSAITNYMQVLVIDTLGMATSMALTINDTAAALTEIDSFTYVRSHKLSAAGDLILVATGTNANGDSATTRGVTIAFARAARPWSVTSLDANFRVSAPRGAVLADHLLVIADGGGNASTSGALSSQYVLGHGGMMFEQPVQVMLRRPSGEAISDPQKRDRGMALYHLSEGGQWVELPSTGEDGVVAAWTRRGGVFRLGERTLVVPEKTWLSANYPNPFNPSTSIAFDLGLRDGPDQKVTLIVYNLLGQQVKVLVDGILPAGQHQAIWNGTDQRGHAVASGIYFVRLQTTAGRHFTSKMALLK